MLAPVLFVSDMGARISGWEGGMGPIAVAVLIAVGTWRRGGCIGWQSGGGRS